MKTILKVFGLLILIACLQNCSLFSAAGIGSQGQPIVKVVPPLQSTTKGSLVNLDHSQWDVLLKKYVNNKGLVNYIGFKKDQAALQSYLQMLSLQQPNDKWSAQELLAYYINLYNAHTVNLIVENYPVKSIKDINGAWIRAIVPIGKNELSLASIENGVLRKMNEPRIHFAINCASISCPNLLNEAFTAAKINEQLDKASRNFITSDKNSISANRPQLSSIFDWYKKDYKVNGKSNVIAFINQYSSTKISAAAVIEYKEYNWNLNEQ